MNKLTNWGKFLVVYQMLGGGLGLIVIGMSALEQSERYPITLWLFVPPLLSLIAGSVLAMGRTVGYGLSVLAQILQMFYLKLKGCYYFCFLLGSVVVAKDARGDFLFTGSFGASGEFRLGDVPFQMAGINLIALFMLFILPKVFVKPLE